MLSARWSPLTRCVIMERFHPEKGRGKGNGGDEEEDHEY